MGETLTGSFSFSKDKGLSFTCSTNNDFVTVREGLIRLRKEIDRQLEHQSECPYYQSAIGPAKESVFLRELLDVAYERYRKSGGENTAEAFYIHLLNETYA